MAWERSQKGINKSYHQIRQRGNIFSQTSFSLSLGTFGVAPNLMGALPILVEGWGCGGREWPYLPTPQKQVLETSCLRPSESI